MSESLEQLLTTLTTQDGAPAGTSMFIYGANDDDTPFMTIRVRCDTCGQLLVQRVIDVRPGVPAPDGELDALVAEAHLATHASEAS